MSYAVRNTIILLVTLFLILGLGFAYYKFYMEGRIESLQQEVQTKRDDYRSKQNINDDFEALNDTYQAAIEIVSNYDKALYPSSKSDDVYNYLNQINEEGGNRIFFDFVYNDSTPDAQYGIIESSVSGYGNYSALTDFVNRIENSQLLNKVTAFSISPGRSDDDLNDVNFSFDLESFYQKQAILDSLITDYKIVLDSEISTYNPFYPLIQSTVPENTEGLIDIELGRLVGITGNRVFMISEGKVISLKVGDRVYLGTLSSINLNEKSATFNLNKGGIQEVVTLEVNR